jgi:hypothetical protein
MMFVVLLNPFSSLLPSKSHTHNTIYTTSLSRPPTQHTRYQPPKCSCICFSHRTTFRHVHPGTPPFVAPRSPALLLSHAPYRPSASWTYPHRMKPTQGKLGDAMSLDLPFPQTRNTPHWLRTHRPPPCVFAFCFLGHAKHCGDHTPVLIVMDAAMKEMKCTSCKGRGRYIKGHLDPAMSGCLRSGFIAPHASRNARFTPSSLFLRLRPPGRRLCRTGEVGGSDVYADHRSYSVRSPPALFSTTCSVWK